MHSQDQVRDGLIEIAETAKPTEGYVEQVLQRAARMRSRRRLASVSAAVVCLAVTVAAFRLVGPGVAPPLVASPPDGSFLGWEATGEGVGAGLVRQAADVWDGATHASPGPHTAVRALLTTHDRSLNAVVVLQAYDKRGLPRVSFFTSDATNNGALTLRADRPAPDPVSTQVISLVSSRLTGPSGAVSTDYFGTYAIAVAMPGITKLQVGSTAIDQELRQGGGLDNGRFVVQELPIFANAQTTTVVGFAKSQQVFRTTADGGGIGDAEAVQVTILDRKQQHVTVALPDSRAVRPGQLAVAATGLVGRVAAVDPESAQATIDLVTSAAFSSPAYTDISNVPGTVRGTDAKLMFDNIGTGDKSVVNEGNRVLIQDPAQRDPRSGAVTIGRAATTKLADQTSVAMTPAVDITRIQEISIMTPFIDGTR